MKVFGIPVLVAAVFFLVGFGVAKKTGLSIPFLG